MKLPVQLVEGFDDIQQNFENLQGVLTAPGSSLPFLQLLASEQLAMNYGTATVTFSGSAVSGTTTVDHGLGRTPVLVLASGITNAICYATSTYGAVDFSLQGEAFGTTTGTTTAGWLAIG